MLKNILLFILITQFYYFPIFGNPIRTEVEVINSPLNIVDYFLILPQNAFLGLYSGNEKSFQFRKDIIEKGINKKEEYVVGLNKEKTFLSINYNGLFKSKYEISYIPKDLKSTIIAVVSVMQHEEGTSHQLEFFKYNNKEWIHVTRNVLPDLSEILFSNETLKENSFKKFGDRIISKNCSYEMDPLKNKITLTINRKSNSFFESVEDNEEYDELLKKIVYHKIIIEWNKEDRVFEVIEKFSVDQNIKPKQKFR